MPLFLSARLEFERVLFPSILRPSVAPLSTFITEAPNLFFTVIVPSLTLSTSVKYSIEEFTTSSPAPVLVIVEFPNPALAMESYPLIPLPIVIFALSDALKLRFPDSPT